MAARASRPPRKSKPPPRARARPELWALRLYIAGRTARAEAALGNLQRICLEHLEGRYRIEVVDLLERPQLARGDQILAVPTLVRKLPRPVEKVIGDLSDVERVLVGLDLRAVAAARRDAAARPLPRRAAPAGGE